MKKKLLIFTVAAAITALTACTGTANNETENVSPSQEPKTEAITSEISDIEESTENIDLEETENTGTDEEAGIETKFVNGTGKTMDNFSIKLQGSSVGLGVIEDGGQIVKKIEAVEKDAKIEFVIDGDETRLALEDGFQGSKIVINSDGNDGYVISYEGIDE